MLVPKPFFARWILPGLGLQLLVNPAMANVFGFVKILSKMLHEVDPGRVFRWGSAILPVIYELLCQIMLWIKNIVKDFVKKQNKITVVTTLTDI